MSFFKALPTKPQSSTSPALTWVEYVALPIVISLMEAQPLAMGLAFLALLLQTSVLFNVGQLVLFLLFFLWWTMTLNYLQAHGRLQTARTLALLQLSSLLVAWIVVAWPSIWGAWINIPVFTLLVKFLLMFWLWRRSQTYIQLNFAYATLATSFKVGLGAMLAIIFLALFAVSNALFLPTMEASLTVFFFCGLIALSLARLEVLRQASLASERHTHAPRLWLVMLISLCCLLLVLILLLEAVFSYNAFLGLLSLLKPIQDGLGTALGWLLYVFVYFGLAPVFYFVTWLIHLVHNQNAKTPPPNALRGKLPPTPLHPQAGTQLPPALLALAPWLLLLLVALLFFFLIRASLRRHFRTTHNELFEETREDLDRHALQRERRQGRPARVKHTPGPAFSQNADTVRAFYRLLLAKVATLAPDLALRLYETPLEYEQRLLTHPELFPPATEVGGEALFEDAPPSGEAIFHELTQGYIEDRYGYQALKPPRLFYLQKWVPKLLSRIEKK